VSQNHVLDEILEVIAPDTRDRVQAVVSKHSKMIHEALYHLTRLEIRNEPSFGRRGTLDVLLEEGHATSFRPGALSDLEGVQAQLASLKPSASRLHDAVTHFQKRLQGVPDVLKEFPELQPPDGLLDGCLKTTRMIMDKVIGQELLPEILAVHGERFGTFTLDDSVQGGKVKLYWAVMGYFVYTKPEVSLEGLAEFILAHELAHAFIHVGFDAVSRRWVGDDFKKTDNSLKEALAQYYAVKVVEELGEKLPHARDSYKALLAMQKGKNYRLHEPWLDPETGYHPEIMRAALIPLRQSGPIRKFEEFAKRLGREKKVFPALKKETEEAAPYDDSDLFGGGIEPPKPKIGRKRR
jgi:hypothetical protein